MLKRPRKRETFQISVSEGFSSGHEDAGIALAESVAKDDRTELESLLLPAQGEK